MTAEDILTKIDRLKRENNAIILAHNYQIPEVQDIADYVGDSFALALQGERTDADAIIFCGVDFMAESAKIISPEKIIVHPEPGARCPMAAMVEPEMLEHLKNENPDAAVVSYVNTTAEIKAMSDICCTSSNAVKAIEHLKTDKIIFVPDTNLGLYVKRFVKDKEIILWPGFCRTHHRITEDDILELNKHHPDAEILVHPECVPEVIDIADHVLSTQGMINHVRTSPSREFIIGTERELCYRLGKENPDKTIHQIDKATCPAMKKITLEKVIRSLEVLGPRVDIAEELMKKALAPLERMMELGRGD